MNLERWPPGRLLLVVAAWLLLSPILLFVVTRATGGDLSFGLIGLLVLGSVWLGPPAWLVARWRSSADRRGD
jgi:hypothetical protein